ncbi:MAG: hypothetical protein MUF50_03000, partial [Planctomycetes bacterium]|nr:hypothetical protein [Planctomycetota bacterium]
MKQNRINIKVSGVPANVNQVTLGYYFNALIEVTSAVLNQTEESKDDGKKVDEVSVNKTNLPQPKNSFRIDPDGPMIIINVNLSKNISNKTRDKLQMEIEIVTKKI